MNFDGEGYIIKIKNHSEKSMIVTLVCPKYGKITAYANGAQSKKKSGIFQPGNYISFNAYARVQENMLSLKNIELQKSHLVEFMLDSSKIEALSSMCTLLDVCLAENDDLGNLYTAVDDFFQNISVSNWLVYYSFFEFYLLEFLGIGLDISSCAVTGKTTDLQYVSPKTGRAVCSQIGAPYKEKLFAYPHYIVDKNYLPSKREISDVLQLTGSFLSKNFLHNHNLQLPQKRANLLQAVQLYHKI